MSMNPGGELVDVNAVLPRTFDWTAWCAEIDDTIQSATVTVVEGTATVTVPSVASPLVTVKVGPHTAGLVRITCHVVSTEGFIDEADMVLYASD